MPRDPQGHTVPVGFSTAGVRGCCAGVKAVETNGGAGPTSCSLTRMLGKSRGVTHLVVVQLISGSPAPSSTVFQAVPVVFAKKIPPPARSTVLFLKFQATPTRGCTPP